MWPTRCGTWQGLGLIKLSIILSFLSQLLTMPEFICLQVHRIAQTTHCVKKSWNYLHVMLQRIHVGSWFRKPIRQFWKNSPSHPSVCPCHTSWSVNFRNVSLHIQRSRHNSPWCFLFPPVARRTTLVLHQDVKCLVSKVLPRWCCTLLQKAPPCSADDASPVLETPTDSMKSDSLYGIKIDPRAYWKKVHDIWWKHLYRAKPGRHLTRSHLILSLQPMQSLNQYTASVLHLISTKTDLLLFREV